MQQLQVRPRPPGKIESRREGGIVGVQRGDPGNESANGRAVQWRTADPLRVSTLRRAGESASRPGSAAPRPIGALYSPDALPLCVFSHGYGCFPYSLRRLPPDTCGSPSAILFLACAEGGGRDCGLHASADGRRAADVRPGRDGDWAGAGGGAAAVLPALGPALRVRAAAGGKHGQHRSRPESDGSRGGDAHGRGRAGGRCGWPSGARPLWPRPRPRAGCSARCCSGGRFSAGARMPRAGGRGRRRALHRSGRGGMGRVVGLVFQLCPMGRAQMRGA